MKKTTAKKRVRSGFDVLVYNIYLRYHKYHYKDYNEAKRFATNVLKCNPDTFKVQIWDCSIGN